jgi:hypothetical protein
MMEHEWIQISTRQTHEVNLAFFARRFIDSNSNSAILPQQAAFSNCPPAVTPFQGTALKLCEVGRSGGI